MAKFKKCPYCGHEPEVESFGGSASDAYGWPGRSELDVVSELPLSLSLGDLISGGIKQLIISSHEGSETVTKSINVKLPENIYDGAIIRLRGQGKTTGQSIGDLYLKIRLLRDERFVAKGDNLDIEVPVSLWEAALGATVTVEAPNGEVKIKLPAWVASGQRLRLAGRGLPRVGGGRGDLYVVITIEGLRKLYSRVLEALRVRVSECYRFFAIKKESL